MLKLEQMDKKLKCSLEDRQEIRKELRHNKNENLDNYFTLARATEDNLQQMAERVKTTDKEREKNIKKDMEELKRRYESVNDKLWNLETILDTISRDQAESSCVIQSKQDAFLSNSIAQEKTISDETEKQPGPKVYFVEPQRKKQESTPLPQIHNSNSIGSVMTKTATKRGLSNSSRIPRGSGTHTSGTSDVMTWASPWELMNTVICHEKLESSNRGGDKMRKTFKKPKELKDDSDGCTDTWVEVMRLYLEQNNLNDERKVCTAILSNLEGTALKSVVAKKEAERDTADKIFEIFLNRFESGMKGHQAMARFEEKRQRDDESVDRFLNDLEILRIRNDPEESNNRRNSNIALKFINRVKGDDLRKCRGHTIRYRKIRTNSGRDDTDIYRVYVNETYRNTHFQTAKGEPKTKVDVVQAKRRHGKQRSCANCGSAGHHVADCTTYKQGVKSLGYTPDGDDMNQMKKHEFL